MANRPALVAEWSEELCRTPADDCVYLLTAADLTAEAVVGPALPSLLPSLLAHPADDQE
ncbi:hypothetical protein ACFVZL_28345 [Streptomyces sp. NPDC058320]|uniref:hypothetical protein n=1 Tax=unclassified Streptomyces TaxID=2593676 RepID=UPI003635B767